MEAQWPVAGSVWAHSFEEDEGDIWVYRPRATFAFPPSRRGRETLVFNPSGQAIAGMLGPDDRTVQQDSSRRFEVIVSGPDILKVRMI